MGARSGIAVVTGRRPRRFRPVHRLRLIAVRVLDPISWYMQKQERVDLQALRNRSHPGRPQHVSTVDAYVPTPRDRPLTHDEILKFQTQIIGRTEYLLGHHREYFRAKAAQLLADGEATLTTTEGVQTRLVRF